MIDYILELFLLYAMGLSSGVGIMLFIVWVMQKTGHDINELWEDENDED